jgi:TolB protein
MTFGHITCDRDGHYLAYALIEKLKPITQEQSLWLVDVTGGSPRKLLDVSAHVQGLRFHPDGKSVLVSSDRGGARNIWDVPIDGGEPTQVTFGAGPDHSPAVSSDGRELVFHVDATSIALSAVPIDGGPPRRLTTALENVLSPAVSPDGRLLAFDVDHGARSTIELMTLATGEVRTIGDGRGPQFSRDGHELVSARGDELVAMPLDGAPRSLGRMPGEIQGLIQDLPEGHRVIVLGAHGLETWLRAPNGTLTRIPQVGDWLEMAVLPNRWRVAMPAGATFALIPPGGRLGDPAFPSRTGIPASWVDEPPQLFYVVGDDLWRHDFTTDRDERVIALPNARQVAMSPDGKTVYVTRIIGHVRRNIITNFGDRPRPP